MYDSNELEGSATAASDSDSSGETLLPYQTNANPSGGDTSVGEDDLEEQHTHSRHRICPMDLIYKQTLAAIIIQNWYHEKCRQARILRDLRFMSDFQKQSAAHIIQCCTRSMLSRREVQRRRDLLEQRYRQIVTADLLQTWGRERYWCRIRPSAHYASQARDRIVAADIIQMLRCGIAYERQP